jgi:anti-anti-sigma factor
MPGHEALHEPLTIRLETRSDAVVVAVSGACDLSCHEQLRERLLEAEALEPQEVVVDLTCLSFIDSNGLRVLIGAWSRSRQAGHRFRVVLGDSGQVRRVLEVTGVHRVLPVATPEHA